MSRLGDLRGLNNRENGSNSFTDAPLHDGKLRLWNTKKILQAFDSVSHTYLMRGLQKYKEKMIPTVSIWATTRIARLIQPTGQQISTLASSALKMPVWVLIFFHIFVSSKPNRHEKCWQMFVRIFVPLHSLRISLWSPGE